MKFIALYRTPGTNALKQTSLRARDLNAAIARVTDDYGELVAVVRAPASPRQRARNAIGPAMELLAAA